MGHARKLVATEDLDPRLRTLQGWSLIQGEGPDSIRKTYKFGTFSEAVGFVSEQVAELAETADHHPDILISYNKVTLTLSTHSEGGLTEKDFELARQIDQR